MAEIVRRFNYPVESRRTTVDMLRDIGIPPEILGEMLNRLSERHLLAYTEDNNYVPARSPASILVRDVVEAVSGRKMLVPDSAEDAVSMRLRKTFEGVKQGVDSTLGELNLDALIDGTGE